MQGRKTGHNAFLKGANLSHRALKSLFTAGCAVLVLGACKKKEAPAIIEEVPAAEATETDTTSTLSEEPDLKQIGGKKAKPGSVKATFHPSAAAGSAGFSEAGHFVIQVSVFKSKNQAAKLVEKLANAGFPAYVAEVENPTPEMPGTYHRVRIGNFMRVADAKAFGDNTLSGMGYQYWVDNKKNDAVGGDGSYSAPVSSPATRAEPSYKSTPAATPNEPSTPTEPSAPSGETWGTPKSEEPAAPAGESWGNPSTTEAPVATPPAIKPIATPVAKPVATPAASKPVAEPSVPSTPPASKAPADTGKVNLDEW
jgi:hypothetical protein